METKNCWFINHPSKLRASAASAVDYMIEYNSDGRAKTANKTGPDDASIKVSTRGSYGGMNDSGGVGGYNGGNRGGNRDSAIRPASRSRFFDFVPVTLRYMAESQPHDGSSTSDVSGGCSDSNLQLNIKTLDSRIYSFNVDKNMVVSAFKEKIASQSGVPVGQQRLIFRGKVLKDDHLLSEYNVENGDTLHLVERQPQPSSGSSSREAVSSSGGRGQDPNAGGSRNRIGPIAHSIVLGTLNVGDPGEAVVPDLSRVIGAVLNTIGIGTQTGGMQTGVPTSNANETEASRANAASQSQNQSVPWQAFHGQAASQMQTPLGAAIAVPSLNMPIPDSLSTLIEFMNRMELAFSQNGNQPNQSTVASDSLPTVELPSNSRGLPTVDALSIVLQRAQRLLSDHAVPALSHTAGRLNQEGGSNDPVVRGQLQTESTQLGMGMQHLGALLLELGRTILTLRMGQSPAESFVNAGPAVYISPSGPNPIMVQPFPLQTSSLFGASSGVSPSPMAMGPVGVASIPRNVNIHIHTGASLAPIVSTLGNRAPNGEGTQEERTNASESGDSGQARVSSGIGVTASAVPQPAMVSMPAAVVPGVGVQHTPDSNSISSVVAEINAHMRTLLSNMQNNPASSGQTEGSANQDQLVGSGEDTSRQGISATSHTSPHVTMMDDQKAQTVCNQTDIKGKEVGVGSISGPTTSSEGGSDKRPTASDRSNDNDNADSSSGIPLGLGLGGLQPKRRGRQQKAQTKDMDSASASSQDQQSRAVGQHVLQSLASLPTRGNRNPVPSRQSSDIGRGGGRSVPTASQNADGQSDVADAMSQILHSPALDGLLSGVSQQTGVGTPDMLRNMLQQFTQNPAMRNTVNQIAQQIDSHDLGSMFSGLDRGPGGGIDLSTMMQQMMPIVSQALVGVSSGSQLTPPSGPVLPDSRSRRERAAVSNDAQGTDLRQVVQRLENPRSSEEIFHSLVDMALNLSSGGSAGESVVNELCSHSELAQEFMEMLHHDILQRLQDEMGS
ncbi:Ubiquitin-like domain-containing protein CIP73 [Sesamum alatum]|uniref:Ubiquitin-like domain-containing protein CIP73 n=1 Tax=Sesamum alatum TaxID=300844 RepID=A0AAE1YFY3_9LAMI|nr:Ubiquitin-like domain-containing protein CIP73 [Sesamum alatum]